MILSNEPFLVKIVIGNFNFSNSNVILIYYSINIKNVLYFKNVWVGYEFIQTKEH